MAGDSRGRRHLVPRLRDPAQRQHAAVRAAQGHRGRGRARRVLRGACVRPACPASPASTSRSQRVADIADGSRRSIPAGPSSPASSQGWFAYVLGAGTTRNGVFGAKMMWNYFDDFRARVAELPGPRRADVQRGARRGVPRTCASSSSAGGTRSPRRCRCGRRSRPSSGATRSSRDANPAGGRVRLSTRCKHLVDELHRWDARWEDWFHATGREPIRVIYEEFVDARAATVGRVLDALGIDPPEPDGSRGRCGARPTSSPATGSSGYRRRASVL